MGGEQVLGPTRGVTPGTGVFVTGDVQHKHMPVMRRTADCYFPCVTSVTSVGEPLWRINLTTFHFGNRQRLHMGAR